MSKKHRRSNVSEVGTAPPDTPFNNALSALSGLRDALPPGKPDVEQEALPTTPAPASRNVPRRVVLQRERKGRGGKTVTRVQGLGEDAATAARWLKELKTKLGCGGTMEGEELILLGDIGDRLAKILEAAGIARVVRGG